MPEASGEAKDKKDEEADLEGSISYGKIVCVLEALKLPNSLLRSWKGNIVVDPTVMLRLRGKLMVRLSPTQIMSDSTSDGYYLYSWHSFDR
ncbi:hypothetical protein RND71_012086 [Anisodus tanguticus]|uniref:Uncharacterized protein n=1 Tax=Anisodus tanguticus TaxID=243964 RepID=A0AAE1SCJ5_9SOLA|nr:hypothetical protein RND71_012086 [Anisodus tanguticus]